MRMQRIHLFVEGRVQGVGFRHASWKKAIQLGVRGWVRNTPDGRVEIVAEGDEKSIEELLSWCRIGPPAADVRGIKMVEHAEAETFASSLFEIR